MRLPVSVDGCVGRELLIFYQQFLDMAKRKRQGTEAQADPSDKARRFTDKLANCLVSGAHGPIQVWSSPLAASLQ